MDGAGGVDIALTVGPHRTQKPLGRHDWAAFLRLLRRHQLAVVDADRLEDAVVGLKPLPTLRRSRQRQPAGHVKADRLAGFPFDLGQKVDGIGLKRGHVRVGIERVNATRRVPA